jgi:hypothetical protein
MITLALFVRADKQRCLLCLENSKASRMVFSGEGKEQVIQRLWSGKNNNISGVIQMKPAKKKSHL